jgi:hypothetical protein
MAQSCGCKYREFFPKMQDVCPKKFLHPPQNIISASLRGPNESRQPEEIPCPSLRGAAEAVLWQTVAHWIACASSGLLLRTSAKITLLSACHRLLRAENPLAMTVRLFFFAAKMIFQADV